MTPASSSRSERARAPACCVHLLALAGAVLAAAPAVPEVPTSDAVPAQVTDGAALYAKHCASCHGEALAGTTHAPALTGEKFYSSWDGKPARQLYRRIVSTMPLGAPGSLEPEIVLGVTTYVLWWNKQSVPAAGYADPNALNAVSIARPDRAP